MDVWCHRMLGRKDRLGKEANVSEIESVKSFLKISFESLKHAFNHDSFNDLPWIWIDRSEFQQPYRLKEIFASTVKMTSGCDSY